ncbi:MAG: phosphoadenylyl-sulfate reductase [Phycisphaerae bacterium]|nr:phosphoadenylyl-sulfate reductase [Phycisphaerae bacterium]
MNNIVTIQQAETLSDELRDGSVLDIIRRAVESFGEGLGFMTALGYSGIVLLHHILQVKPDIEAHFIDTGFHFPETLAFLERLREEWKVNFVVVRPTMTREELTERMGPEPWRVNADLCCHHMKVEPLLRVIHDKAAWLSAIRRDQSATRAGVDVVELDGRGVLKINPLAYWTSEQVWEYIRKHNLPYHPLHDEGFPSIGCLPCTAPVQPGEHERSGRWNSMPKLECGLHLHARKAKSRSKH